MSENYFNNFLKKSKPNIIQNFFQMTKASTNKLKKKIKTYAIQKSINTQIIYIHFKNLFINFNLFLKTIIKRHSICQNSKCSLVYVNIVKSCTSSDGEKQHDAQMLISPIVLRTRLHKTYKNNVRTPYNSQLSRNIKNYSNQENTNPALFS